MWLRPEPRGVVIGCLYLEIEGQSWLVGGVDQGLMKTRQIDWLDRMTKHRASKKYIWSFFPIVTLPAIFQQITPKKCLDLFWLNYRLFIVIGLGPFSLLFGF